LEGPHPPGAGITQLDRSPVQDLMWVRLQVRIFERNIYITEYYDRDVHIALKAYSFDSGEQEEMWSLQWCLFDFYNHVANVQLFGV
jgi:hypothetical protein